MNMTSLRTKNLTLLDETDAQIQLLVQAAGHVRRLALALENGVLQEARHAEVFSVYRDRVSAIERELVGVASGNLGPEDHQTLSDALRALSHILDPVGAL